MNLMPYSLCHMDQITNEIIHIKTNSRPEIHLNVTKKDISLNELKYVLHFGREATFW